MTLYQNMSTTALKQIDDKGRSITIQTYRDMVYDVENDTFTEGETTTVVTRGLFTSYATKDIDGELIRQEDKLLLLAANIAKPDNGAEILDGDVTYQVINTDVVQPGDTPILYMVQIRR